MLLPSFSISPDKGNGLLLWVEAIGVANATTHCVCVRLQDWSWCQWQHPTPGAFKQQLRMCSRVPVSEHSWQAPDSTFPQQNKLNGLGRTSQTAWIRDLMRWGTAFHSAVYETLSSSACSHLAQAPCFRIATALLICSFSTGAHQLYGSPRNLLTLLLKPTTVEILQTKRGHRILRRIAFWYSQALNLLGRPDLLTRVSQVSRSWLVTQMDDVSLRLQLSTFPWLFTSFSMIGCMLPSVKQNLWEVLPFFSTRNLDFNGLKLMQAQVISSLRPFRIHLRPGTHVVVTTGSW